MSEDNGAVTQLNETDIEWDHRVSPNGSYESYRRNVSGRLTAASKTEFPDGAAAEHRPFEVELVRIPSGKKRCPRHAHTTQWEYYIILSGQGRMLTDDGDIALHPGDHVIQPPGWVHTVANSGEEDLVYYVIANNPSADIYYYPDSNKWGLYPQGLWFRTVKADYFDGEE